MNPSVISRYKNNPILTERDVSYPVATVHNAGVIKHRDDYIMLFRSHLHNGRSIIGKAVSKDGYDFKVDAKPFLVPAKKGIFAEYEEFGVEDLRINPLENTFYLTYSAYSRYGVRIMLAKTDDFESIERIAPISQADMRNLVLFPEKIAGKYVRLDRPHTQILPWSIWISYSDDLIHWGNSKVVIKPVQYHWDESKVGPGSPPVKAEQGWLHIFHGVFMTMSGAVYRLGAALHDLHDPSRVIGVTDNWILQPEAPWEVNGYVHNVVFTCGTVPEEDGTLKIYWGGADTVMCVGTANIKELIELCINSSRSSL
jgi:beta-1,2-mannobiose phosphorylase / 1,2-beta-oligomannan phosphorylase